MRPCLIEPPFIGAPRVQPRGQSLCRSAAAAVSLAVILGGCGSGVEISLQLRPGIDANDNPVDTSGVRSLLVSLDNGIDDPHEESIDVDPTRQVPLSAVSIDKTRPFTIDVFACTAATCTAEAAQFRGCNVEPLDLRDDDGVVAVNLSLLPIDDTRLGECAKLP